METPVRVGIIGAGHWGPNLIRNFHDSLRAEVVWVVDVDEGRLAQVSQRYPDVKTGTDASLVIDDPSVDAVVVATPTVTHFALTRQALRAGKHVLVEKPIATDSAQGEELRALAEEERRVLLVGHVFLFNAGVRKVKEYLDRGDLGRVYYISMVRTNLGPIRMDVNAAWDLAAHDISISSYWLGAEPVTASAVGGTWINPGIADAVFATLRYPGDVLVNLHVSWLNPRKARDITLVGDRRMLTFDDMSIEQPVRIYDKQVTEDEVRPSFVDNFASFRASVRDGDILIPKVRGAQPLGAETEHFLDCILQDAEPVTGGKLAVSVVRCLEAMDRSAKNRGREKEV